MLPDPELKLTGFGRSILSNMDSFQSAQSFQIRGKHSHVLLPQEQHLRDTPDSKSAYAQPGKLGSKEEIHSTSFWKQSHFFFQGNKDMAMLQSQS